MIGLIAALASGALMAGALYFQYVVGLPPCDLCHWQRYPHIASIGLGLASVASLAVPRLAYVFALAAIAALFITAGIGLFHVGVEQHWWAGPQACSGRIPGGLSPAELKKYLFSAKMVRCDQAAWSMWGISMAGWNAILSAGVALMLSLRVARQIREHP
ncbi:MAG: disulfide bond formation protein B [Proteobacteria bacterium]|nr:disulfide bond formation protein B [Pseudomonadota bacterium]